MAEISNPKEKTVVWTSKKHSELLITQKIDERNLQDFCDLVWIQEAPSEIDGENDGWNSSSPGSTIDLHVDPIDQKLKCKISTQAGHLQKCWTAGALIGSEESNFAFQAARWHVTRSKIIIKRDPTPMFEQKLSNKQWVNSQ